MADDSQPTSLTLYLSQAYLSPLILGDTVPPAQPQSEPWPRMEELFCSEHHSRLFKKVTAIPIMAIENAVRTYYLGFEDRVKIDWNNGSLTLPCPGISALGSTALARLIIRSERDYMHALQQFILATAAEAIRTIKGRPFDDDELTFVRYRIQSATRDVRMCTLYTFGEPVPPSGLLRPGIVIVSLPPWMFGLKDFKEFASPRKFAAGEIDREPPGSNAWSNATKLWAMVHDSCKVSGHRWFVVTTYNHWIFGTWSLDWTATEVSPTIPFDRTRGMTVVEMLVFWTQSSRNEVRYWQIAPSADR